MEFMYLIVFFFEWFEWLKQNKKRITENIYACLTQR